MNANIMKTQFFHKIMYDLKCHFYVMDKFCPCFIVIFFISLMLYCNANLEMAKYKKTPFQKRRKSIRQKFQADLPNG